MNRRASVADALPILVQLFIFGMVSVLLVIILNNFNTAIQSLNGFEAAKSLISGAATTMPGVFDFWFFVLFVGLPLLSAVLAYFNNVHPFLFWLSILFSFGVIILGKAFELGWDAFAADPTIAAALTEMPITNTILADYGLYSFFVFVIIAGGTYIKLRGGVSGDIYGGL